MNTYKDLNDRAGVLHEKINDRIYYEGLHSCRRCAEHGRHCGIADKEKLIAIRDSLRDVQNMLEFLQTLECWQQRHYNGALTRLEESRMILIEEMNKYPTRGTKLNVIEELRECFGDGKTVSSGNLAKRKEEQTDHQDKKEKKTSSNLLIICLRGLFNPWKWYRTTRIAAIALIVVSASISSPVNLYTNVLQHKNKNKTTTTAPRINISTESVGQLEVSYGKG